MTLPVRRLGRSGIEVRSPALGARKPLGVVSAPTTRATSHSPARMRVRAASMAVTPEAQAAYDDATRAPFRPMAWANVAPET